MSRTTPRMKTQHKKGRQRTASSRRRSRPRRIRWGWIVVLSGIAAVAAGLVITSRNSDSSEPMSASPFVGGDLHSLIASMDEAGRVYVGGHEGVATSSDGGHSWSQIRTLDGADAMGWAFLDSSIWVGGHPGLAVSTDGGRSFEQRNDGLPATDIHALGGSGDLLYAASPAIGVLSSDDGGDTWRVENPSVGQGFMGRILVDPADPAHIVAPDMQAGAVESEDGGQTWQVLGGVRGAMWVTWDRAATRHIVVSSTESASETSDGGRTWKPLDVPSGASMVEMGPGGGGTLYAASHVGTGAIVFVSNDGGESWART